MKKGNIFIAISIVFLGFMLIFYGSRMIYFYTSSRAEQKLGETGLASVLQSKSYDKAIKSEDKTLYYVGSVLNNYVYYSNRYYRILSFNDDSITLIDDAVSTILPYDDIDEWLDNVYYNSLLEPDKYLSDVSLLSKDQYYKADNGSNFLKGNFFWLDDQSYVNDKGNIMDNDDGIYGVRVVVTLKNSVLYYGGTGTYFDPYFIDDIDAQEFNGIQASDIRIGSYIKFSDKVWRVIEIGDTIKLALSETIGEYSFSKTTNVYSLKDKNGIAYYLNDTFLDELNWDYLVKKPFNIGTFKNSYSDTTSSTVNAYVGMMNIGDLYILDTDNYYTLVNTGVKNTVYKVVKGKLYADSYKSKNSIRPVINIIKDIKVTDGMGTLESPFEVEKK